MNNTFKFILLMGFASFLSGCATKAPKPDYTQFKTENPRSILIVPAVNKSVDVNAPDFLLSTISVPLAERGYYVFPVHLTKSVMEENGMNDADMVHSNGAVPFKKLFGTDTVMYITIERWDSKYALLSTTTTVELNYVLKSTVSGLTLWTNHQLLMYTPQQNNSGGIGGLIANAIAAAVEKSAPNYIPLAQMANSRAVYPEGNELPAGYGLPAGPYDKMYNKDNAIYGIAVSK